MDPFKKQDLTTMTSVTNKLREEGYNENFVAKEKGLEAPSLKKIFKPEEVKINSFYRFEGESDPGDNAIVYALEADDGTKGMLIDAYGAYSDVNVSKFIAEVEDISKGVHADDE